MATVLVVAVILALWLALLLLLGWLTSPPRLARGRARRRGGYVKLAASPGPSPATLFTTDLTDRLVGSFSSSTPPGGVSEAWTTPRTLRDPSRLTGRGWSTLGTAGRGASGARLGDAA